MAEPVTNYITTDYITDQQLKVTAMATLLQDKIDLSTLALQDYARKFDVQADMISTDNPDYVVKQWCKNWVCAEMFTDLMGKNKGEDLQSDVYFQKYKLYDAKRSDFEMQINYEVLTNTVFDSRARASNNSRTYRR